MSWREIIWSWKYSEQNDKFVNAILTGEANFQFEFQNAELNQAEVRKKLLFAKDHLEMVKIVRPFFSPTEFSKVLGKCEQLLSKHDEIAQLFLDKADQLQKEPDLKMALRAHNLALSFAKSTESLRKIYRSRSSLLFLMKDFDGCVLDTQMGISDDCPDSLLPELNDQLLKCKSFGKSSKTLDPNVLANREYCKNVLFHIEGIENEFLPGASNSIEIRTNGTHNRGIFATGSIPTGTTLIVEDPFVSSLTDGLNWEMTHCWKCSKTTTHSIPCPTCVFAIYCSEECRLCDWEGSHVYECPCLPYLHGANLPIHVCLGFKSMCKAGPLELHKIYSASKHYGDFRKNGGIDPLTKKYDGKKYTTVVNLISHVEDNEEFPQLVLAAISLTHLLSSKTNFFDQIKTENNPEEFKEFVASLALFHGISAPFNCLGINDIKNHQSTSDSAGHLSQEARSKMGVFQIGVYPLISLLNHSCDPNVGRASLKDGRSVIVALKDLKAEDELVMSYKCEFTNQHLHYRQDTLSQLYLFGCECLACQNDWPLYDDLEKIPIRLRCPDCTAHFNYADYEKCVLEKSGDFQGTCKNCKKSFDLHTLYDEIKDYPSPRNQAKKLLRENRPSDVIPAVVKYSQFIQARICPPCLPIAQAQRILKLAYFNITHIED